MPRVIDISLETYLRKIGDILNSNLIKVLAYDCKGFTKRD